MVSPDVNMCMRVCPLLLTALQHDPKHAVSHLRLSLHTLAACRASEGVGEVDADTHRRVVRHLNDAFNCMMEHPQLEGIDAARLLTGPAPDKEWGKKGYGSDVGPLTHIDTSIACILFKMGRAFSHMHECMENATMCLAIAVCVKPEHHPSHYWMGECV